MIRTGRMNRAPRRVPALLAALLPFAWAGGAPAQERFSLPGDVAVFNLAGEIRVEAGTGSDVVVEVTRGGRDADRLDVDDMRVEGWRAVRVHYPEDRIVYPALGRSRTEFTVREDGTFGRRFRDADAGSVLGELLAAIGLGDRRRITVRGSGSGLEAWADIRVLVPRGGTVAVNLGAGEIHAANLDGEIFLHGQSAAVSARNMRGPLDIDTGSGRIELDGAEGDVNLDTGSGSVRAARISAGELTIDTGSGSVAVSDVEADEVEIDTGSGSIQVDGITAEFLNGDTGSGRITITGGRLDDVTLDTGSGSVSLALLAPLSSAEIDTGSGGVTISMPPGANADLELDSGSGGVTVDMPVRIHEKRRNYLRATIGDGGGLIRIDTGSGGIRIRTN